MKRPIRRRSPARTFWLEALERRELLSAQPMITEMMAANTSTIRDGNGEASDWIEIYNAGDSILDLSGWHLTDDLTELTKWTFPSISLPPASYLLVFASGQGSDAYQFDEAGYLHTNFQLDSDGETVALVAPDATTIVSTIGGADVEQIRDVSYGVWVSSEQTSFVDEHTPAQFYVPQDDLLGQLWTTPQFMPDTRWRGVDGAEETVFAAVGYQQTQDSRFTAYWPLDDPPGTSGTGSVIEVSGGYAGTPFGTVAFGGAGATPTSGNALVGSGSAAGIRVPYDASLQSTSFTVSAWARPDVNRNLHTVISSRRSGTGLATGYVLLHNNGRWQFWTGDGASWDVLTGPLVVPNQWVHVAISFDAATQTKRLYLNGTAVASATNHRYVPQVGQPLHIGAGEDNGTGAFFDGSLDDVAYFSQSLSADVLQEIYADGLSAESSRAFAQWIETDVGTEMYQANTSGYLRIPFTVDDPASISQLLLKIRYDDGFVAYLNGQLVSSSNAPTVPQWNSAATCTRTDAQALAPETYDLSTLTALLQPGANVLAIQGLNASLADPDFLLAPELFARSISIGDQPGYFAVPTPGAMNVLPPQALVTAKVNFSQPSRTFSDAFLLTITTDHADSQIRFTTDGTLPTATSALYTTPILIDQSVTVRARVVAQDAVPGAVAAVTYLRMSGEMQSFRSHLPVMIIDNLGAGTIPDSGWNQTNAGIQQVARQPASLMLFDNGNGETTLQELPELATRMGIRIRGSFSSTFPEPGYSVETWRDDSDDDRAVAPLGLAADSDWILYAPNPAFDSTLIDNAFLFDLTTRMGHWAPGVRYVEAFVNKDGGDIIMSDYVGLYAITEKVKRTDGRLDYQQFSPDGTTGGWLLNINRLDPISESGVPPRNFHTAGPDGILATPRDLTNSSSLGDDIPRQYNAYINYDDPNGYDINRVQRDAIHQWFQEMEDVLYGRVSGVPWNDPVDGYAKYIDVTNFIDFFILNNLSKHSDALLLSMWLYNEAPQEGGRLRFGPIWDTDLGSFSGDPTTELLRRADQLWFPRLFQDAGFQQAYTDRWQELRVGVLSDAEIGTSIDRWFADIGPVTAARDGVADWQQRLNAMKSWVATRSAAIDATMPARPRFVEPGGPVTAPYFVGLTAAEGEIYVTTDGTDPRLADGSVAPTAIRLMTEQTPLVSANAAVRVIVPTPTVNDLIGNSWILPDFQEGVAGETWSSGTLAVGYDTQTDYDSVLGTDLGSGIAGAYLRIPFTYTPGAPEPLTLALNVQYDDGMVAYLNGVEIARSNTPGSPGEPVAYNAAATTNHEADLAVFEAFDVTSAMELLVAGENLLAFQLLNVNSASSDLLLRSELILTTTNNADSRLRIEQTTTVKARTKRGTAWSGLVSEVYLVGSQPPQPGDVIISEIYYHPSPPTTTELQARPSLDENNFEYLELTNIAEYAVDLAGVRFGEGLTYVFPQHNLQPGDRVVIARDPSAFALRFPAVSNVVGPFHAGQLSNSGERLVLATPSGGVLADIEYRDNLPWSPNADGIGASLEWIAGSVSQADRRSTFQDWRGSVAWSGTPGAPGSVPAGVMISEVRASWQEPSGSTRPAAIELHNETNEVVDISGWYLSDDPGNLRKFRIPDGTSIVAGGFRALDEAMWGGVELPETERIALPMSGSLRLWLTGKPAAGAPLQFVDTAEAVISEHTSSVARIAPNVPSLVPAMRATIGCENSSLRHGTVLLSELQVSGPIPSSAARAIDAGLAADDLEFIELFNAGLTAIDLTGWRLSGGVDFDFTSLAGVTPFVLQPEETLVVVPFSTQNQQRVEAFRAHYGMDDSVVIIGGYQGQLSDAGEFVQLERRMHGIDGAVSYVVEDMRVAYDARRRDAAETVQRSRPLGLGGVDSSWIYAQPSVGFVSLDSALIGDATGDRKLDGEDVDRLVDAIRHRVDIALLDWNDDAAVDELDYDFLIRDIMHVDYGDSNLDGTVDAVDFSIWQQHQFQECGTSWSQGNFNIDAAIDVSDWNVWNSRKFLASDAEAASGQPPRSAPRAALPVTLEPSSPLAAHGASRLKLRSRSMGCDLRQSARRPEATAELINISRSHRTTTELRDQPVAQSPRVAESRQLRQAVSCSRRSGNTERSLLTVIVPLELADFLLEQEFQE